jgi:hypothetical protein
MDYTTDELAYEMYLRGDYTYEDYCDICNIEECKTKPQL